jgi:hypothetical protein
LAEEVHNVDPEPLLSSLKGRLDLLNELVIWSAAAAVSSGAAAYFGDKKIEIGPVSIPFKAAFYTLSIVFTLLLITIAAASYRSLIVFHLIPPRPRWVVR